MSKAYDSYIEKQNAIYDTMRTASSHLGSTEGIEQDPGTEPQAAYLVVWRHPEHITDQVEELSIAINGLYQSVLFNRFNAHTTLSDYGLTPHAVIHPTDTDTSATLDILSQSVKKGLDSMPQDIIADRGIAFGDVISNKKAVIATGHPTEATWNISEAVKAASASLGIDKGRGLKGSWGSHMTISRFPRSYAVQESKALRNILAQTPEFGTSLPTALEVGYFQTDPHKGFVYTTHDRYELP